MHKVLWWFNHVSLFESGMNDIIPVNVQNISHPWFSLHVFINFMEKELFTPFYGRFDQFSWTYEVVKFWMIKLCLDVRDVIHANEHTYHTNYGLHANFWKLWLMPFKKKLLLWPQVHFKVHVFVRKVDVYQKSYV